MAALDQTRYAAPVAESVTLLERGDYSANFPSFTILHGTVSLNYDP